MTLIREADGNFLVTDGIAQATAPKSSFTNDLELVAALTGRKAQGAAVTATEPAPAQAKAPAQADKFEAARRQLAAKASQRRKEESDASRAQKKERMRIEMASLNKRIRAAEEEIAEKKSTQRPIRKVYDYRGNLISYQGHSTYTLSADASGLKALIEKRDKLKEELAAP